MFVLPIIIPPEQQQINWSFWAVGWVVAMNKGARVGHSALWPVVTFFFAQGCRNYITRVRKAALQFPKPSNFGSFIFILIIK